jgi:hypothetical protein
MLPACVHVKLTRAFRLGKYAAIPEGSAKCLTSVQRDSNLGLIEQLVPFFKDYDFYSTLKYQV